MRLALILTPVVVGIWVAGIHLGLAAGWRVLILYGVMMGSVMAISWMWVSWNRARRQELKRSAGERND